jgi:hypothetical protein
VAGGFDAGAAAGFATAAGFGAAGSGGLTPPFGISVRSGAFATPACCAAAISLSSSGSHSKRVFHAFEKRGRSGGGMAGAAAEYAPDAEVTSPSSTMMR